MVQFKSRADLIQKQELLEKQKLEYEKNNIAAETEVKQRQARFQQRQHLEQAVKSGTVIGESVKVLRRNQERRNNDFTAETVFAERVREVESAVYYFLLSHENCLNNFNFHWIKLQFMIVYHQISH